MSTMHEKVEAQQWAFYSKPTQPFHRHLIGPAELEALLKMVEQLQPKPHAMGCDCEDCANMHFEKPLRNLEQILKEP